MEETERRHVTVTATATIQETYVIEVPVGTDVSELSWDAGWQEVLDSGEGRRLSVIQGDISNVRSRKVKKVTRL